MPKNNNGWTERRKKQQACAIRRHKPWEKSTGPKSKKGKEISSMNALKHGGRSISAKEMENVLRHNRAFLKSVKLYMIADDAQMRKTNELLKRRMESKE